MRELAKSMFKFSLAMSVFGLEQFGNLVSEKRSGSRRQRMSDDLDSVAQATRERFTERMKTVYESGDRLQNEMVDLAFDFLKQDNWKPGKVLDRTADLMKETADALRDTAGKKSSEAGDAEAPEGSGTGEGTPAAG